MLEVHKNENKREGILPRPRVGTTWPVIWLTGRAGYRASLAQLGSARSGSLG